jgi:hypothetical protein
VAAGCDEALKPYIATGHSLPVIGNALRGAKADDGRLASKAKTPYTPTCLSIETVADMRLEQGRYLTGPDVLC